MEKYIPDIYVKNVYDINYELLLERGIKLLLFDLDNTLVPYNNFSISKKLIELVEQLKDRGFKIIIFSNSNKKRVSPFKKKLRVDCLVNAKKPLIKNYNKVMKIYNYDQSQTAIIGDKLITDILGGNKAGITTILVNSISIYESIPYKIFNIYQKRVEKRLAKGNLFVRGNYYER